MKLASLDKSMSLNIASPGMGMAVTLSGHVWLFDRDGNIVGSLPPRDPPKHIAMSEPERCPGCAAFVVRDYGKDGGA
jgi:hypothetical protein